MDFNAAARWLWGGGVSSYSKGGTSSHAKRKNPVTPEMRQDADYAEGWMRSGKTAPLYKKLGANPKAT